MDKKSNFHDPIHLIFILLKIQSILLDLDINLIYILYILWIVYLIQIFSLYFWLG